MEKREKYSSELNRLRPILLWGTDTERLETGQWILNAVLPHENIIVKSVEPQKDMVQVTTRHSVTFDMLAQDTGGSLYNVEFQKSATEAERMIFYSSVLGVYALKKGENYNLLRNFSTIFIEEKARLTKFPDEILEQLPVAIRSDMPGRQVVIVDAGYNGPDALGDMLHDLWSADPDEIKFPVLRKITRELKYTEKGREHMCEIIDELVMEGERRGAQIERTKRKEEMIATIKWLLADGSLDLQKISLAVNCPLEEVQKIAKDYLA